MSQCFGKYHGIVINNIDPMMRGKLLLHVPDVLVGTANSAWAKACVR
ncbi:MAG: hypothetical protein ABJB86_08235 [Bacteroidota bacterium]